MYFTLSNRQKNLKTPGLLGDFVPGFAAVPETTGEDFRQWLADLYHCCEEWGMRYTVSEFRYTVRQWAAECAELPEFVPVSAAVRYWNQLADIYPN